MAEEFGDLLDGCGLDEEQLAGEGPGLGNAGEHVGEEAASRLVEAGVGAGSGPRRISSQASSGWVRLAKSRGGAAAAGAGGAAGRPCLFSESSFSCSAASESRMGSSIARNAPSSDAPRPGLAGASASGKPLWNKSSMVRSRSIDFKFVQAAGVEVVAFVGQGAPLEKHVLVEDGGAAVDDAVDRFDRQLLFVDRVQAALDGDADVDLADPRAAEHLEQVNGGCLGVFPTLAAYGR